MESTVKSVRLHFISLPARSYVAPTLFHPWPPRRPEIKPPEEGGSAIRSSMDGVLRAVVRYIAMDHSTGNRID